MILCSVHCVSCLKATQDSIAISDSRKLSFRHTGFSETQTLLGPKKRAESITPWRSFLSHYWDAARVDPISTTPVIFPAPFLGVRCFVAGRLYALLLAYAYPSCSDASPRSPRRQRGESPPRCKSKGATRRRRPGCRRPRCSWRSSTGKTRNPARLKPRRLRRERHLG